MNHFADSANKKNPDGNLNEYYQGETFTDWLDNSDLRVKQYNEPLNQKKDKLISYNNELHNLVVGITRLYKQLMFFELDNTVGETAIILRRTEVLECLESIKFYSKEVKHCVLEGKFDSAISFKNYCIEKFSEIICNIEFFLSIRVYDSPLEMAFRDVLLSFETSINIDELKILYECSKIPTELISEVKTEKQNQEDDKPELDLFHKFDQIRFGQGTDYEIISSLKELSNNYEIDLLESLQKDIEFYLFVEKDIKESEFDSLDIENAVKERMERGLEIPYYKRKPLNQLTDKQIENRKRLKSNGFILPQPTINYEELLFPIEFFNIYRFKNAVTKKISDLQASEVNSTSDLSGISIIKNETTKPKKIRRKLIEFIHNVKDKEAFLEDLKATFTTERGKSIKIIITILEKESVLIINNREFKDFHVELQSFFIQDIGTRQSVNDVKFDEIHLDIIEPIQKKLNPLILKHKGI